ncbi:MAG: tetratricopeptide repeat protein [Treponemataceae bacterium]
MYENSENLNIQAIELASIGEYKEALACLKCALSYDKTNYLLWFNLGIMYRASGDLESAKSSLLQALNLSQNDDELFDCLGLVHYSLQDYPAAFDFYIRGLEVKNTNPNLWNNLGVLLFIEQDYKAACDAFEQAVTIYPHFYDALFNLRDTYEQLGDSKAAEICNETLKSLSPPKDSL